MGMGEIGPNVEDSAFLRAVEDTLKSRVHAALKAPLMKIAEAEVDAAVAEAVAAMNIQSKGWRSMETMRETVEFLLKRAPAPPSQEDG
jgi:hypothetical protein